MNCPHCGNEIGRDDAIPKSVIRTMLTQEIDAAQTTEDKLRAIDLLAKLEGYTGANATKEQKKVGVKVIQQSMIQPRPGKSSEDH